MNDRFIGLAGLIVGILSFIAPYFLPKMPSWIATAGLCLAFLLIGLAVAPLLNPRPARPKEQSLSGLMKSFERTAAEEHFVNVQTRDRDDFGKYHNYMHQDMVRREDNGARLIDDTQRRDYIEFLQSLREQCDRLHLSKTRDAIDVSIGQFRNSANITRANAYLYLNRASHAFHLEIDSAGKFIPSGS
jgi:hypothetical protein